MVGTWDRFLKAGTAALAAAVFVAGPVQAQVQVGTIMVNTLEDELNEDGDCSLREAIQASNINEPVDACAAGIPGVEGTDTITFDPNLTGQTIVLDLFGRDLEDDNLIGDLDILDGNLIIAGPATGAGSIILDGAGNVQSQQGVAHRVLHVPPGASYFTRLELRDLTIQNGALDRTFLAASGAGLAVQPNQVGCTALPVENPFPCLALRRVAVINNSMISTDTNVFGGGVAVRFDISNGVPGSIVVEDSIISNNTSSGTGPIAIGGGMSVLMLGQDETTGPVSLQFRNNDFDDNSMFGGGMAEASGGGLGITANNVSEVVMFNNQMLTNRLEGALGSQGGGASLTLNSLMPIPVTIQFGRFLGNVANSSSQLAQGGGLHVDALNLAEFNILNSDISENTAESSGGQGAGGGAALQLLSPTAFPVNISNTDFLRNDAFGRGSVVGAGLVLGAQNLSQANIDGSRFSSNFTLHDQVVGGRAAGAGAFFGLTFSPSAIMPSLLINGSEFSDNGIPHPGLEDGGRPGARGAGLSISVTDLGGEISGCPTTDSCVTLQNSTISGNFISVPNGDGLAGGLFLDDGITARLRNVTQVRNQVDADVALAGGIAVGQNVLVDLANTVIAENMANGLDVNCSASQSSLNSLGYNFVGENASCNIVAQTGDQFGVEQVLDPGLGMLSFQGESFTRSHQPLQSSPLVDAGNPAPVSSSGLACDVVDQNGLPRPLDGDGDGVPVCDIGAVELLGGNLPPLLVNPVPDQTLVIGGVPFSIDLNNVFEDPEAGPLVFEATSNNSNVVIAGAEGSNLILQPVGAGSTTVDISAFDEQLAGGFQQLQVTVVEATGNLPPQIIGAIPDQALPLGSEGAQIDLNGIFADPEGDELFFEAQSNNTDVVTVSISGSTLILTPGIEGVAVVVVTALDSTAQATTLRLKSRASRSASATGTGGSSGGASLGSSGGGGCALVANGTTSRQDPLFALLLMLALAGLLRSREA